jgi:hypothetical protein
VLFFLFKERRKKVNMGGDDLMKDLGYDDGKTLDDVLYDDDGVVDFYQRIKARDEKVRNEAIEQAKNSFEGLSADQVAELEKRGVKYADVESYAREIGANKITDSLVKKFEEDVSIRKDLATTRGDIKRLEKKFNDMSVSSQSQNKGGAGEFGGGSEQPATGDEKPKNTWEVTRGYLGSIL